MYKSRNTNEFKDCRAFNAAWENWIWRVISIIVNVSVSSNCLAIIRFTAPFHVQKNLLQVPFSFHRQWLYRYPKYVLFHYDGNKYFIRVRRHGGKCFFADGLKEYRRAHDLNESVILRCVASDKNTTFSVHILPAAASRFVHASKKFITLQRGLAKRTHWDITIHNDVPSVADPWFHLLDEKKLIPGDEVVFYYRFDDHAWELLDKKDIEWENDDINFEEM
ncbi:hypothetical protein GmHk_12G035210 [Glycine max]|nr:hypothetical protein GmHk_12G035210 [Glycine max]